MASALASVKRQTGRPIFFTLSATLAEIPLPGNATTPIGSASSRQSLRLNGRGAAVARPVELEDHLRHLALIGPAGGDLLSALGTAALQQHTRRSFSCRRECRQF